jgi:hypothetical protein
MRMKMKKIIILLSMVFFLPLSAGALEVDDEKQVESKEAMLQSYEPNRVGLTFDDNDVGFVDFTLSLQYPFLSLDKAMAAKARQPSGRMLMDLFTRYLRPVPYLAFTGRFGHYLDTRESSPIVGKRFNPKILMRFFTTDPVAAHLDIGFAHESNGQRVNSAAAYQDLRADFAKDNEEPDFARDYISRGWDYWEVLWYKNFNGLDNGSSDGLSTQVSLKYFMEHGYLQGDGSTDDQYDKLYPAARGNGSYRNSGLLRADCGIHADKPSGGQHHLYRHDYYRGPGPGRDCQWAGS